jgi:hypothetical protein
VGLDHVGIYPQEPIGVHHSPSREKGMERQEEIETTRQHTLQKLSSSDFPAILILVNISFEQI